MTETPKKTPAFLRGARFRLEPLGVSDVIGEVPPAAGTVAGKARILWALVLLATFVGVFLLVSVYCPFNGGE